MSRSLFLVPLHKVSYVQLEFDQHRSPSKGPSRVELNTNKVGAGFEVSMVSHSIP